jgi:hypothetical protein
MIMVTRGTTSNPAEFPKVRTRGNCSSSIHTHSFLHANMNDMIAFWDGPSLYLVDSLLRLTTGLNQASGRETTAIRNISFTILRPWYNNHGASQSFPFHGQFSTVQLGVSVLEMTASQPPNSLEAKIVVLGAPRRRQNLPRLSLHQSPPPALLHRTSIHNWRLLRHQTRHRPRYLNHCMSTNLGHRGPRTVPLDLEALLPWGACWLTML